MKLSVLVFIITAGIGLVMPVSAYRSAVQANLYRFENMADETVDRVALRVSQHISLLTAARALFEAKRGDVSYEEFASFVRNLRIEEDYEGIQGIGFAALVPPGSELAVRAALRANYGIDRPLFPGTDQPVRTAVVMLEPSSGHNDVPLGYDMYSDPTRRAAMIAAARTGKARASGRVELLGSSPGGGQTGFLVYLPFYSAGSQTEVTIPGSAPDLRGFVYAPFRADDLIDAALKSLSNMPVHIEVYVGEPTPDNLMFADGETRGDFDEAYRVRRTVDMAGQNWQFVISPSAAFQEGPEKSIALLLGVVLLMTAAALVVSFRSQMKALEASREVLRVTQAAAAQKDFLLQEMKHRLKNSIARVLAIARQTASHSGSLEEFTRSFTNRLQAMAASQDLLTHSHQEKAELAQLLEAELQQVFGQGFGNYSCKGPPVELGFRATQALALVFHELATNALKYADMAEQGNRLDIEWRREDDAGSLTIDWREQATLSPGDGEGQGFGTRLIRSLITGELGGEFERQMADSGLSVRLAIPAASLA